MAEPLLSARDVSAFYGDFQALFGIDFDVYPGETVAVVGSNGAGKSTFLRCLTGMLPASGQEVRFRGEIIGGRPAHEIVRRGLTMVPEGRRLFRSLSVEENLLIGSYGNTSAGMWKLHTVYDLFPMLRERRHAGVTKLSGGQQQMVAIGRALMSNPKLLLCDEISLGLAPKIISDIYAAIPQIKAHGATIIVVEQDVNRALGVASRVYCFQEGRVSLSGSTLTFTREQISTAYFGLGRAE